MPPTQNKEKKQSGGAQSAVAQKKQKTGTLSAPRRAEGEHPRAAPWTWSAAAASAPETRALRQRPRRPSAGGESWGEPPF